VIAALIRKGADAQKVAIGLAKSAIAAKDDLVLGAVVLKAKQSVLDTLDLDYKHLVADGFPHAAAQLLKRTVQNIGMHSALFIPRPLAAVGMTWLPSYFVRC
jgi:hypothetical protein